MATHFPYPFNQHHQPQDIMDLEKQKLKLKQQQQLQKQQPIDWPPYRPLPAKLQYYGKHFSDRFMGPRSTLERHQVKCLQNLVRWFGCPTTRLNTAVVVMPPATGSVGVVCCLPFALGGGVARETISKETVNIGKPILVIAPGHNVIRLLEENLIYDPYLMRKDLLQQPDKEHNYTVHTVLNNINITNVEATCTQYDIILTGSQTWRKASQGTPTFHDFPSHIFSVVIVDHAHLLPAHQWAEIVAKFRDHARIVFFTATPSRGEAGPDVAMDMELSTKSMTYKLTRERAIQDRLMRDIQLTTLAPSEEVEESRRADYMKLVVAEVRRVLKVKNERWPLVGSHKHMAVLLVRDTLEAQEVREACVEECEFAEEEVAVMHSQDVPKEVINSLISRIQAGAFKVVILDQTVLEDFNHPPISVAGILTRLRSPVFFAHFVGRVQRVVQYEDLSIKANLITHRYYQQRELFAGYVEPVIPSEEDTGMDDPAN